MCVIVISTPASWFTSSIHWIVDIAATLLHAIMNMESDKGLEIYTGSRQTDETIVQSSTKRSQIGIVVGVPVIFT